MALPMPLPPAIQAYNVTTLPPSLPPPEMPPFADGLLETEPPPAYHIDLEGASRQWGTACNAANELEDVEQVLKREELNLDAARRELELLKRKSARCFSDLHSRPRKGRLTSVMHRVHLKTKMSSSTSRPPSSQSLHAGSLSASPSESSRVAEGSCLYSEGREGNEDRPSVSLEVADQREIMAIEFEKSHAAEVRQAARVAELEDLVSSARRKRDILLSIAKVKEDAWAELQHIASGLSPPSHHSTLLGEAIEALNTADSVLRLAARLAEDMRRARQTVQHAHHYLTKALTICDNIGIGRKRSGGFSVFGGFAGMGRITDYQESVFLASRAQVCLTECLRVLSSYTDMFPENVLEDYKALKEYGVLQMAKVYNLVFGGRTIDSGVGKQIQHMLDRQDKLFAHLTQLAVWVQNEVPVSEAAQKRANAARDAARARLAALWTEAAEQG